MICPQPPVHHHTSPSLLTRSILTCRLRFSILDLLSTDVSMLNGGVNFGTAKLQREESDSEFQEDGKPHRFGDLQACQTLGDGSVPDTGAQAYTSKRPFQNARSEDPRGSTSAPCPSRTDCTRLSIRLWSLLVSLASSGIGGPNGHVLVKSAPWVAVTWYLVYRCFFLVGALTLRSGQVFRIRLSPF